MPQLVYITNIQKFCTHDGPGIRTNVFFKGRSLQCKWCANPETIDPYPQLLFYRNRCTGYDRCVDSCDYSALELIDGKLQQYRSHCVNCGACTAVCPRSAREIIGGTHTPEEVFEIVNQDKVFYEQSGGGVTFSGGEPLLHPDFLQVVAEKCKREGYNVTVESCGCFDLDRAMKVVLYIDYLLFDIKIIDPDKHVKYCGHPNINIHRNFEKMLDMTNLTPRMPIIPSVNDTPVDIAKLCQFFSQYSGKIQKIHILPYHNLGMGKYEALDKPYELADIKPPSDEHMEEIKADLEHVSYAPGRMDMVLIQAENVKVELLTLWDDESAVGKYIAKHG